MSGRIHAALRHPLTVNALVLYAGQFALTVLPLVVLPYLARVLGPGELGVVVFVQYFSFLLGAVLEYGFSWSATREVARRRDDPEALEETVAGVMGAKAVLVVASGAIALVAWPLVPLFRESPELLALGIALTLGQGLVPIWYYTGVERLSLATAAEIFTRVAAAVAIFVLVDGPEDATLVLLIYAVVTVGGTAFLHVPMYRRVRPRKPTRAGAALALRQGSALFVSTASVTVYNTVTVVLLGLIVPAAQVAFFSGAEKVIRAGQRALSAAGSAVYPRVAFLVQAGRAHRANRLAFLTLMGLTGSAILTSVALVWLAEPIVDLLYGPGFGATVPLLRVLGATLPLAMLTATLSTLWLLPHGLDRVATAVFLGSGALDILLLLVFTPVFGLLGAAWVLFTVEVFTALAMAYAVRRAGVFGLGGGTVAASRPAVEPVERL